MQADYVIVGAGSAGCCLANRLTEDADNRVVLIEAGGRDWNPLIHIPAGYMKLLEHPTLTWGFKAEADAGTNGRAINYPRGRVLGGSSSINGMIYVRGQPEDFDHWGQLGNRGWSWDDVLPFFRKAENWEGNEDSVHGKGGPLFTSHGRDKPLLCQAAVEAAKQLGCEYREDVNDLPPGAGDGIGWVQQTRGGRRRASSARSYLRPALKRPNLQVITGALVHRVLFDGTRAVGVEFSRNGNTERVDAAGEVILAAGAIGSPHILQLSGVGDPEHLARAGIPVHHELSGVGRNLQDHYLARLRSSSRTARPEERTADADAGEGPREPDADRVGRLHAKGARPGRWRAGVPELRPRRVARVHRLAAVLQRLGDEGPVPRHPQQPGVGRGCPQAVRRRPGRCSTP